jgi:hypothetical protein
MAFPASPINGQTVIVNNVTYTYDSTQTAWVRASGSLTTPTSSINTSIILNNAAINESSSSIAAASTMSIGAANTNYLFVTGSGATITAFDTIQSGTRRILEFQGVNTLTHNATTLILPGTLSITTSAGDVAQFISEGSGNWRCSFYQKAGIGPTGVNWQPTPITANGTTIVAGNGYFIDTTSAAFTITAPASAIVGDTFRVVDISGKCGTNNLTIAANGLKFPTVGGGGAVANFVIDVSNGKATFVYSGSTQGWVLI